MKKASKLWYGLQQTDALERGFQLIEIGLSEILEFLFLENSRDLVTNVADARLWLRGCKGRGDPCNVAVLETCQPRQDLLSRTRTGEFVYMYRFIVLSWQLSS